MHDIWRVVQWWDDWQLRILVLGSTGLQWFLLLAAPMRKFTIPHFCRTCIWLAYISSDALAIYALATLFNRHARGSSSSSEAAASSILEVLWAPILLIHLGGQKEMTAYQIEDNELGMRHTVTLVSQVAVALYAFCKSWPSSSDWTLLVTAVLLFVVGVVSFSEKPFALNKAKFSRLTVSAWVRGTRKPLKWTERINLLFLFEEGSCFSLSTTEGGGEEEGWRRRHKLVALTEADKLLMVLSDMPLLPTINDLIDRGRACSVDDILPNLPVVEKELPRWLRNAFAIIYTRATVAVTPLYLVYHLLVVPVLHIASLTLFARSDKHPYKPADVKITYIILCLTAAMDVLAVFIRQLLYRLMFLIKVPTLCETVPSYNLIDAAVWEVDKSIRSMCKCASRMSFSRRNHTKPYGKVAQTVIIDLVDVQNRDLASYRIFDDLTAEESSKNWALSMVLQRHCGAQIRKSLRLLPFDQSVLLWHMATDLCERCCIDEVGGGEEEEEEDEVGVGGGGVGGVEELEQQQQQRDPALRLHRKCAIAISNYMAHLLNVQPEMLMTGSRPHLISEAVEEVKRLSQLFSKKEGELNLRDIDKLIDDMRSDEFQLLHIKLACMLAKELLEMQEATRWMLMYRVWLGMLCYSATMCRGYLHAKSLGEGGEFLTFIWLTLVLKGNKCLADKLQMPPET